MAETLKSLSYILILLTHEKQNNFNYLLKFYGQRNGVKEHVDLEHTDEE